MWLAGVERKSTLKMGIGGQTWNANVGVVLVGKKMG